MKDQSRIENIHILLSLKKETEFLIIRYIKIALFFVCYPVYSAQMVIIDEGRYISFTVIPDKDDDIAVDASALHLNLGLNLNISDGEKNFRIGVEDKGFMSTDRIRLVDSFTIGRRLPKMTIAFLYGLKYPGEYVFDVKLCLNKDYCMVEKGRRIEFTKRDMLINPSELPASENYVDTHHNKTQ